MNHDKRHQFIGPAQRLFLILLLVAQAHVAFAQTIANPTTVQFDPSADHAKLAADGSSVVQEYLLSLYLKGQTAAFKTLTLGKPAPGTDGTIRLNARTLVSPFTTAGVVYEARVTASGKGGVSPGAVSNRFQFTGPTAMDYNGDGIGDLLLQDKKSSWVETWLMDASGHASSFQSVNSVDIGTWKTVGTADLNHDGISDILLQDTASTWVGAWLMDANGTPVTFLQIYSAAIGTWKVVGTVDLNNDGNIDILLQDSASTFVAAWLMNSAGTPTTFLPIYSAAIGTWTVATTGDLNGDGIGDIILQDTKSSWVGAWLMDGAGHAVTFAQVYSDNIGSWTVAGTTDLNRDGHTDIVLQDTVSTSVAAWLMDGAGHAVTFVSISATDIGARRVNGKG